MAQRRLRDYQDPLGSFEHNLINLGVHYPGRFCGFDTLTPTGGLTFKIGHATKGIRSYDVNALPIGPFGVAMTNQGLIVVEDADLVGLAVAANPTASVRNDQLVMTHQYTAFVGGFNAVYEIVKGVDGTETFGALTPFQTLLGIIQVPIGASDSSGLIYSKAPVSDSGDQVDAKLEAINTYLRTNEFRQSKTPVADLFNNSDSANGVAGKKWLLNSFGNTFSIKSFVNQNMNLLKIDLASNQDGTEINLQCDDKITLVHATPPSPAETAAGYANIKIPDNWRNVSTNSYKPSLPGAYMLYTLIKVDGSWLLKNVVGIGVGTNDPTSVSASKVSYAFSSWQAGNFLTISKGTTELVRKEVSGNGFIMVDAGTTLQVFLSVEQLPGSSASLVVNDVTNNNALSQQNFHAVDSKTFTFTVGNGNEYSIVATVSP